MLELLNYLLHSKSRISPQWKLNYQLPKGKSPGSHPTNCCSHVAVTVAAHTPYHLAYTHACNSLCISKRVLLESVDATYGSYRAKGKERKRETERNIEQVNWMINLCRCTPHYIAIKYKHPCLCVCNVCMCAWTRSFIHIQTRAILSSTILYFILI